MRQFNAEELRALATGLAPILIPMLDLPAFNVPKVDVAIDEDELDEGTAMDDDGNIIYTDPIIQTANETTERAMKALPTGTATYVGRNSTQIVNHSAETMNAIEDWKRKRNQWKTRNNIR